MAPNISNLPENAEEWQAQAQEAAGDPLAALMKDIFQKEQDEIIASSAYQKHHAAFSEKLKGLVLPGQLQHRPDFGHDNTRYSDIPKPIDKADEQMESQLKSSIKACGPNEVALVRISNPTQIAQAIATADRIRLDCMIATPDGLVLHGNTPAMETVRGKLESVMVNGNTLPAGPGTNMNALVNGVFNDYKNTSIMEWVNQYGITEKPGVSFIVAPGVTLKEAARMITTMHETGVHNPAIVMGNEKTDVLLRTENEVSQAMIQRHAPVGEAPGLAQFRFDNQEATAQFLTEMSDVSRELGDAVRGNDGIGIDENDALDSLE